MPDESPQLTRLERAVEPFRRHGAEVIVIGGQAQVLHGGSVSTKDVDFCYRRTPENLERVARAVEELHPHLRGAPPDLPFRLDAGTLAMGLNFTLATDVGDLDLLGEVPPIGTYEALAPNAERYELPDGLVWVIGLDDLIRVKSHVARDRDKAMLPILLAIKRTRDEQALP